MHIRTNPIQNPNGIWSGNESTIIIIIIYRKLDTFEWMQRCIYSTQLNAKSCVYPAQERRRHARVTI